MKAFQVKYDLPFTLLSDRDKSVSKLYGADGVLFAKRRTYLINGDGIIFKIYPKVDVRGHAQEIIRDFKSLH